MESVKSSKFNNYCLSSIASRIRFPYVSRDETAFTLFCWYSFLLTFGSMLRVSYGPSSFGVTSIVLPFIIGLRLPEAARAVFKHKLLWLLLIIIVYIAAITISNVGLAILHTFDGQELLQLVVYVVFASAISTLSWTKERVVVVSKYLVVGFLFCTLLIAIDMIGWIDVPRINDAPEGATPGGYSYGQFGHRTVMGLYMATIVPFLMVLEEIENFAPWYRASILAVGGAYWYILLWSLSRSGPAAILASLGLYYLTHLSVNNRLVNRKIPDFAVSFGLASLAVLLSVPYSLSNYLVQWASSPLVSRMFPGLAFKLFVTKQQGECILDCVPSDLPLRVHESDMVRWQLLQDTVSCVLDKPWGSGFINDSHASFITSIIHATGVVGLVWLVLFTCSIVLIVLVCLKSEKFKTCSWALCTGLVGWFLVGIMYNAIHLGLAWGMLGILLSFYTSSAQETDDRIESNHSSA